MMHRPAPLLATLGLLVVVAIALLLAPFAAATGSGYNLSYTRGAGSTSNSAIDLVAVTSTDPGGNNLTIAFTVSGAPNLGSDSYSYWIYFDGGAASNSSASVFVTNNSTSAFFDAYSSGGSSSGYIPYHLSGSTVSVSVAKAAVGSASGFGVNVDAVYSSLQSSTFDESWLGTDYQGANGVSCTTLGTCTSTGGQTNAGAIFGFGLFLFAAIIIGIIVVVIVIIVVVVVVVGRSRTPTPPPMMPPQQGGWNPPPPPPGAMPPPPPPPPPPR
ncbi:MAG: hypothetical protein L3K00_01940 [Thermoplasmata archaeon]|nr:hypothetical protein [Thermoplasmata archaeon]